MTGADLMEAVKALVLGALAFLAAVGAVAVLGGAC